jgi:hypothetical protein
MSLRRISRNRRDFIKPNDPRGHFTVRHEPNHHCILGAEIKRKWHAAERRAIMETNSGRLKESRTAVHETEHHGWLNLCLEPAGPSKSSVHFTNFGAPDHVRTVSHYPAVTDAQQSASA